MARHLDRRPRRGRSIEDPPVHLIHRFKVTHVFQVHYATRDFAHTGAPRLQDPRNILEDSLSLFTDVAVNDLLRGGVERNLSANEYELPPRTACE